MRRHQTGLEAMKSWNGVAAAMTRTATVGAAVAFAAAIEMADPSAAADIMRWTQYTPSGLEARAVTDQAICPQAAIDGAPAAMTVRAGSDAAYPVTVCVLPVPAAAKSVTIAGIPVALPSTQPNRILIIGDTGCRMKGKAFQACNDPVQWPARLMAEAAAQLKPDLVIHAGDYHYREAACPAGNAGCAGSPNGDTWAVWHSDFFAPFETLLRVAPWVAVRGNHEECGRGGIGWSRTLEGYPIDPVKGCNGVGAPFAISLPGLTLAVMDVSTAEEAVVEETEAKAYKQRYAGLAALTSGPTWILQHRPIWSAANWQDGLPRGDNKTLAAAAFGSIPANVTVMISGHHHFFQALSYDGGIPAQIVSGHGGNTLGRGEPGNPVGLMYGAVRVKGGIDMPGAFGFAMMTGAGEGWILTNHDRFGKVLKTCEIKGRELSCPSG